MMEQLQHCPICQKQDFQKKLSCQDYTTTQEVFDIVECQACGFYFTNPRPTPQDIGRYYQSEEYISHSNQSAGLIGFLYKKVRGIQLQNKLKLINRLANDHKTILDIGCGRGFFLKYCQDHHWDIQGMEPDPNTRAITQQDLGITLFEDINQVPIQDQVQIISMWHVLEHVHDLDTTIQKIKTKLSDQGFLIVAVPNREALDQQVFQEFWSPYDVPRHLYHFREIDIRNLFQSYQMQVVEVIGMPYDSYYAAMLSNKYQSGKSKKLKSLLQGWQSNRAAHKDNNYSSKIYIIQKNVV